MRLGLFCFFWEGLLLQAKQRTRPPQKTRACLSQAPVKRGVFFVAQIEKVSNFQGTLAQNFFLPIRELNGSSGDESGAPKAVFMPRVGSNPAVHTMSKKSLVGWTNYRQDAVTLHANTRSQLEILLIQQEIASLA